MTVEEEFLKTIAYFSQTLPHFDDGRIDYTRSSVAPVLTVFVSYRDKILLLKRSDKVLHYRGKWNTVAGYLDQERPLRETVLEELAEELGIMETDIASLSYGTSYQFVDKAIQNKWIIYPVLARLMNEPVLRLDWEHTEYQWILPRELIHFDIVPNLDVSLHNVLGR